MADKMSTTNCCAESKALNRNSKNVFNTKYIKNEVVELLKLILKENGFDAENVRYLDLLDDVGIDSLIFMSIIIEIESRFMIEIADEALLIENFRTIDCIIEMIENEVRKTKEYSL